MKTLDEILPVVTARMAAADLSPLGAFLQSNPSQPMVATGSGGAEGVAEFAALLYGARGGVATACSPLSMNSISDAALSTAKILLVSKGGHNADIDFAAARAVEVNPSCTAAICLHSGPRNLVEARMAKAGAPGFFLLPGEGASDGFVSRGTPLAYFAALTRVYQEDVDLSKYSTVPSRPYTVCRNDGTSLSTGELGGVRSFVILHGSWGAPVASILEGKMVESGMACAGVFDYRNHCHGRFIYTSNHLEDSAIVMLVSPRERDLVRRTREFLPKTARLILIETAEDAPEASLDLLVKATAFFDEAALATGVNPDSPANPGRIDKRVPIHIPFKAELKRIGPLSL